jgi:hypothetical protein
MDELRGHRIAESVSRSAASLYWRISNLMNDESLQERYNEALRSCKHNYLRSR